MTKWRKAKILRFNYGRMKKMRAEIEAQFRAENKELFAAQDREPGATETIPEPVRRYHKPRKRGGMFKAVIRAAGRTADFIFLLIQLVLWLPVAIISFIITHFGTFLVAAIIIFLLILFAVGDVDRVKEVLVDFWTNVNNIFFGNEW